MSVFFSVTDFAVDLPDAVSVVQDRSKPYPLSVAHVQRSSAAVTSLPHAYVECSRRTIAPTSAMIVNAATRKPPVQKKPRRPIHHSPKAYSRVSGSGSRTTMISSASTVVEEDSMYSSSSENDSEAPKRSLPHRHRYSQTQRRFRPYFL